MPRYKIMHDQLVKYLYQNPDLLGLSNVVYKAREPMIHTHDGRIITEPDLMFMTYGPTYHWYEVKGTDSGPAYKRGLMQCHKTAIYTSDNGIQPSRVSLVMPTRRCENLEQLLANLQVMEIE